MQSANRAFGTDERGKMRTCRYVDRTTTLELLPLLAFRRTATVHRGARPRFAPSHAQGWPCWLSTTTDALRPLKAELYCKGRSRRHVMCPRCQPRSRSLSFLSMLHFEKLLLFCYPYKMGFLSPYHCEALESCIMSAVTTFSKSLTY